MLSYLLFTSGLFQKGTWGEFSTRSSEPQLPLLLCPLVISWLSRCPRDKQSWKQIKGKQAPWQEMAARESHSSAILMALGLTRAR